MKALALLALIGTFASFQAQADEWIGPYQVTYIEEGSGNVYFMRDYGGFGQYSSGYTGCNNSTVYFPQSLTDLVVSRALAVGLSAQATGMRVKFLVTGCPNNGYLAARAISIDPNY